MRRAEPSEPALPVRAAPGAERSLPRGQPRAASARAEQRRGPACRRYPGSARRAALGGRQGQRGEMGHLRNKAGGPGPRPAPPGRGEGKPQRRRWGRAEPRPLADPGHHRRAFLPHPPLPSGSPAPQRTFSWARFRRFWTFLAKMPVFMSAMAGGGDREGGERRRARQSPAATSGSGKAGMEGWRGRGGGGL